MSSYTGEYFASIGSSSLGGADPGQWQVAGGRGEGGRARRVCYVCFIVPTYFLLGGRRFTKKKDFVCKGRRS